MLQVVHFYMKVANLLFVIKSVKINKREQHLPSKDTFKLLLTKFLYTSIFRQNPNTVNLCLSYPVASVCWGLEEADLTAHRPRVTGSP